ncbi:unannotated protein [freshwater metagenome]|uniref:Unannotated protein n=1 Tax=freshwater metagenome TaxID=449393 RepID=A0A6J6SL39_9ZZZZ|nr:hypothetical protein [Actinomycetota bacterium]
MSEELSPADEARLRRLLGRARHDEPVPEDVAARLDDVLARLDGDARPHDLHDDLDGYAAAARASSGSPAAGAAPPRRPRRGLTLLVAAAAVVVAGVGVDAVVDRTESGGDAAATSEVAADGGLADPTEGRASDEDLAEMEAEEQAEAYALDASPEAATDGGAAAGSMAAVPGDLLAVGGRLVEVEEGSFTEVAERLQRRLSGDRRVAARTQGPEPLRDAAPRVQRAWQSCTPPEVGPGTHVAVLYDGSPAVLVLRPVEGATQVAALLQCGTGEVLRSVTLPVP